jgi:hypothetical protein
MRTKLFTEREKIRLATLGTIRSEMSMVYRSAVRGQMPWSDAAKAAYVLNLIAQLDQGLGIDERIRQVEERLATVKANGGSRPGAYA